MAFPGLGPAQDSLIDMYRSTVQACADVSAAFVALPHDTFGEYPGLYKRDLAISLLTFLGGIKEDAGAAGSDAISRMLTLIAIPASADEETIIATTTRAWEEALLVTEFLYNLAHSLRRAKYIWSRYLEHYKRVAEGDWEDLLPRPGWKPAWHGLWLVRTKRKIKKPTLPTAEQRVKFATALARLETDFGALRRYWRCRSDELLKLLEPPRSRAALFSFAREWAGMSEVLLEVSRKLARPIYFTWLGHDPDLPTCMIPIDRFNEAANLAEAELARREKAKRKKKLRNRIPFLRRKPPPALDATGGTAPAPPPTAASMGLSSPGSPYVPTVSEVRVAPGPRIVELPPTPVSAAPIPRDKSAAVAEHTPRRPPPSDEPEQPDSAGTRATYAPSVDEPAQGSSAPAARPAPTKEADGAEEHDDGPRDIAVQAPAEDSAAQEQLAEAPLTSTDHADSPASQADSFRTPMSPMSPVERSSPPASRSAFSPGRWFSSRMTTSGSAKKDATGTSAPPSSPGEDGPTQSASSSSQGGWVQTTKRWLTGWSA